jgi:hypothetical protein
VDLADYEKLELVESFSDHASTHIGWKNKDHRIIYINLHISPHKKFLELQENQ